MDLKDSGKGYKGGFQRMKEKRKMLQLNYLSEFGI